jgi:hypothetical protein
MHYKMIKLPDKDENGDIRAVLTCDDGHIMTDKPSSCMDWLQANMVAGDTFWTNAGGPALTYDGLQYEWLAGDACDGEDWDAMLKHVRRARR